MNTTEPNETEGVREEIKRYSWEDVKKANKVALEAINRFANSANEFGQPSCVVCGFCPEALEMIVENEIESREREAAIRALEKLLNYKVNGILQRHLEPDGMNGVWVSHLDIKEVIAKLQKPNKELFPGTLGALDELTIKKHNPTDKAGKE